tara:strand:+ start:3299 stop:4333 length:1035 start_codon:yes stop_codon:yes gene_type:complete
VRPQRAIANSSLAFIDVMSCGLGAVILLFVVLDFNWPSVELVTSDTTVPVDETAANAELLLQQKALRKILDEKSEALEKLASTVTQAILDKNRKQISESQIVVIDKAPIKPKPNWANNTSGQLIGLTVGGSRILIAFDTSASMVDYKLINIIVGISDKSGKRLAAGEKWKQAKKALLWTIKNAPTDSQIQVIAYSESVRPMTNGWVNREAALRSVESELKRRYPTGGTSLGRMLEYVAEKSLRPSDIYLITDGLPTISGNKGSGLDTLKSCFKLPASKNSYITGECRRALFISAVTRFQKSSVAPVNIILLALEGDPQAAPLYWNWSASTQGILFSPKAEWPSI